MDKDTPKIKSSIFDRTKSITPLINGIMQDLFAAMSKNCKYCEPYPDYEELGTCLYRGREDKCACTMSLCEPLKNNFSK